MADGFSFEPDALRSYADTGTTLADTVTEARSGLTSAGQLSGGVFGEVGESSGFVAAYAERVTALGTATDGINSGITGLANAVLQYLEAKLTQDEDTAIGMRRVEEQV